MSTRTSAARSIRPRPVSFGLAWGDWDGDGDLDLAVADDGAPSRVYENLGGVLDTEPTWGSLGTNNGRDVAWGDWDGDGDLDLAVADRVGPNHVYENEGGTLSASPVWSSTEEDTTFGVSWGDWDGDGDQDLAVANDGEPLRVYENLGSTLATTATWSSAGAEDSRTAAWGDWDGDGDLDLAASGGPNPARVYENLGGILDTTPAWSPVGAAHFNTDVAWGDWDGDGDLDLAVAAIGGPSRVYGNSGGTLTTAPVWSAFEVGGEAVEWDDVDGDGDLDLAVGRVGLNRVYRNGTIARPMNLPETAVGPVIPLRPGGTDPAAAFSSQCLDSANPILEFSLFDEESDSARQVLVDYSVDGEIWQPATLLNGALQDVAAAPIGIAHQVVWDSLADGVVREPLVRLRTTVPFQASTYVAGPIQRASMRAVSPPFSMCLPAADLVVTLDDGVTYATPGGTLTYTLTIANDGPDDAPGVLVGQTRTGLGTITWTCVDGGGGGVCAASGGGDLEDEPVDLPAGSSVVFTLDAEVLPYATGTLDITAFAELPPGLAVLTRENDSATDLDILAPSTDLSITLNDGQPTAVPGTEVTYMVTVANAGPSDAYEAQVASVFPPAFVDVGWSCLGSGGAVCPAPGTGDLDARVDLPTGASATFFIDTFVDPGATGSLVTSASVFATFPTGTNGAVPEGTPPGGDPDPTNNNAVDVDLLTPEADLAIVKDDGTDVAYLGEMVTYTIEVANPGPSSVVGATVEDVFPVDLLGVSWTCAGSEGGACAAAGSGDLVDSADLPAGATVTYTATATVDETSTAPEISNSATVETPGGVTELDAADNTSTDVDTVLDPSIFEDGFESGATSAWSLTVG